MSIAFRPSFPPSRRSACPPGLLAHVLRCILPIAGGFAGLLHAETVTVTQLDDIVDFGGPRRIADLPGADGLVSFREALIAVNNTPGEHAIEFAIPVDPDAPLTDLLRIDGDPFILFRDRTRIDFLTQAIFLGDPEPNGPGLGMLNTHPAFIGQPAIVVAADECEIRGLGRTQFRDSIVVAAGVGTRIVRNFTDVVRIDPGFGGSTTGHVIGSTEPGEGNEIDTISIACGADANIVIGNRARRIDVTGSPFCAKGTRFPTGNRIGGSTAAEGNIVSGFGTYNGEGRPSGVGILVDHARETVVEGNRIGVSADGTSQADDQNRGTRGISVRDSLDTTIRGNLVAGIRGVGIAEFAGQVFGRAIDVTALNRDVVGVVVEGNLIGTDATGNAPIPTHAGIEVVPGTITRSIQNVRIGGTTPDTANVIAFTEGVGILIAGPNTSAVEVVGNRIHDNAGLGIDLRLSPSGSGGVTANDLGDGDAGPNRLQNFPTIETAAFDGSTVQIAGELSSEPNRTYRIEIFASPNGDPSGHGEGEHPLGWFLTTTSADGEVDFDESIPAGSAPIAEGWIAAAIATDLGRGESSEFGPAVPFTIAPTCLGDLDGNGSVGPKDLGLMLGSWGTGSAGDLDGDGVVGSLDLGLLLGAWGDCP